MGIVAPSGKLEPISIKQAGFTGGVTQADPNLEVDVTLAIEDQTPLKEKLLHKTGKSPTELEKEIQKCEAEGLFQVSEDWRFLKMQEKRPSNFRVYLTQFKGKYSELNEFCYGKFIDDGQVIKQVSPPHPRVWIVGTSDGLGNTTLEANREKIEENYRSRYKLVEWETWEKVLAKFK